MLIRPASATDAPAIAAIWNAIIRDTLFTFTTEEKSAADLVALLAAKEQAGHPFLVAQTQSTVSGFATYGSFRAGPGYAHSAEHTIILAPTARGQGSGRTLLAELEQHARDAGVHTLIGGVSSANPGAQAFHRACGYRTVATLPEVGRKQGQWLDLVLFQKLF